MDPLVSTLALILLALLGARLSFSTIPIPAGPRLLLRTGTHFVFLGILLGPRVFGLVTQEALIELRPLIILGLGWVGILFGIQLDRAAVKLFPGRLYGLATAQAVGTFALVLGLGALGTIWIEAAGATEFAVIAAVAATACVSTPAGIALVSSNYLVRGPVTDLLLFIASIDAVVGLVTLQLVFSFFPPDALTLGVGFAPALFGIPVAIGLAFIFAILFVWMIRLRPGRDEVVLYLLGISALASGAAFWMQLSPLFVCMLTGAFVANIDRNPGRLHRALDDWEKPVYVVLLLLAGAFVRIPSVWILLLGIAYAAVRAAGKVGAILVAARVFRPGVQLPGRFGAGLIPQGGITLAMAVSVLLTYQGVLVLGLDVGELVFETVLIGAVLSELAGPLLTMTVLRRAGELSPAVEDAISEGDGDKAFRAAMTQGSRRDDLMIDEPGSNDPNL